MSLAEAIARWKWCVCGRLFIDCGHALIPLNDSRRDTTAQETTNANT